jgi:RNA-directed DNA polymerase
MNPTLNDRMALFSVGVIQPALITEICAFLNGLFKDAGNPISEEQMKEFIDEQLVAGRVGVSNGSTSLYSLTATGNDRLTRQLRLLRDKMRLYLLRAAHDGRQVRSRVGSLSGMAGVSPASQSRANIEGSVTSGPAPDPEAGPLGPRKPTARSARPPDRGQARWPRVAWQFRLEAGSYGAARDTLLWAPFHWEGQPGRAEFDLPGLGIMLGVSPKLLAEIAYDPTRHYRSFELKKASGGTRLIETPRVFLKVVQWFLLDYVLAELKVSQFVHSFLYKKSVVTNSLRHQKRRYVANLDVANFFGSISVGHVRDCLRANGFSERESRTIARLCTCDNHLPQGAPTSPIISNAILYDMDEKFGALAREKRLNYTRYSDDITVSGNSRQNVLDLMNMISKDLQVGHGLHVNEGKTRLVSRSRRQVVTGVVVNESSSPARRKMRKIRAIFHKASLSPSAFAERRDELSGYIGYLRQFPKHRDSRMLLNYKAVLDLVTQS